MTFTLYWRERTGAFAAAAVLAEAGQAFEAVRVDSQSGEPASEAYRQLNPLGRIPTLVLPDGTIMTESAAIALHLAELFPGAGLLPPVGDGARAVVLRWLVYAAANLYETDLRSSYPARYTSDPAGAEAVRQAALAHFDELWDPVAGQIGQGPFLLGTRYSLVDPYLAMIAAWHERPRALFERLPGIGRLVQAVIERPAIAPLWQQYNLGARL